jgi:excisionase family DNA binding protein
MAYYQPPKPQVDWDKPGLFQGVTIKRQLADGNWYAWRIPYNGVVPQAMAADILGVSVMTINNWVKAGHLKHIKARGQPSLVPMSEIKKVRKILLEYGRLRQDALGQ